MAGVLARVFMLDDWLAPIVVLSAIAVLGMWLVIFLSGRRSQERLNAQRELLDDALTHMAHGLCVFDADGRIVVFNERYRSLTGLTAHHLEGLSLVDRMKELKAAGKFSDDPESFVENVKSQIAAGKTTQRVLEEPNGRMVRVIDSPRPSGAGWIAVIEDITELKQAELRIAHMARHDALTDLPNRAFFRERLESDLKRLGRRDILAVMCLDLDRFNVINDSLGHAVGDKLLKAVAARLTGCVREADTVARIGGDEFAVVQIANGLQPADITMLADRLITTVSAPYEIDGHHVVIGTSIGIALAPSDGSFPDDLLKNADLALYRAKNDGRGTYRFFEPAMDAMAQARRTLEIDLRDAIVRNEFELHYQPIQAVDDHRIVSFEALVRWRHPRRGLLGPGEFVPLAEQTGLIVPMGEWILKQACAAAAAWSKPVRIAVNLSPVQFKTGGLVESVRRALEISGLPGDRLEIEITESVLMQDTSAALQILHRIRDFGVHVSMDDFGTGYSSLSYLRSFPFDKIKIDQSFVREITVRADCKAIVRAVVDLGTNLGIKTTAEGVETEEQMAMLRREGCTEVQGYLFSPPIPQGDVEPLLATRKAGIDERLTAA